MSSAVRRAYPVPRQWALSDSLGLEYSLVADCDDPFNFSARLWDALNRPAGLVSWRRMAGDEIKLETLRVEPEVTPAGLKAELGWVLRGGPKITTYRGRGLGSLLLQIALATAREAHGRRIYAFLCDEHLRESQSLDQWFWQRGFVIAEPPRAAPPGAVHRVSLELA